jgi:NAD(P)-dependent dehydrogenase (short-subunit alcohol dehydrogenase family)
MSSASIAELFSVKGRVALVTGGTSGVGLMIARGFVSNGVKTYVTGLPSDDIEVSVAELNSLGQESGGLAIGLVISIKLPSAHYLLCINLL